MSDNRVEFEFSFKTNNGELQNVVGTFGNIDNIAKAVNDQVQKFNSKVLDLSNTIQVWDSLQNSIDQVRNVVGELTGIYQEQVIAETKLETIMRQRMNATDADVESIKNLAEAQKEIGVIDDDISVSGAQQMATFLNNKSSIQALLPAMNNLIAQQKGLNATSEDAANIGNMMGKAMQGQTGVLQRVGITFTESEEKVLKFGTEEERAAMLAQVITNNVGDMNTALAQTDAGKQKQLANKIDDIRKNIGSMVEGFMPYLTILGESGSAIIGATKMIQAYQFLHDGLLTMGSSLVTFTAQTITSIGASRAAEIAYRAWTAVQTALNAVMRMNPLGMVIVAIGALVAAVIYCYNHFEGFRQICDQVWGAVKNVATAVWDFLVKAFQKASEVIKEAWNWIKNFFGIEDTPVKNRTETVKENNKALQENAELMKKYAAMKLPGDGGSGGGGGKTKKAAVEIVADPGSLGALEKELQAYQTKISNTSDIKLAVQFDLKVFELQEKIDALKMKIATGGGITIPAGLTTKQQGLNAKGDLDTVNVPKLDSPTKYFNSYQDAIEKADKKQRGMITGMRQVGSAMGQLGSSIGGQAGQWLQWGANIAGSVAQAITAIAALIPMKSTEVTAHTASAGAKAADSVADIPIVGPMLAIAAVASVLASLASLPKFANGTLAYGPTLGIFGEYPGASNNPEVVAPLDRLKSLITPISGFGGGTVKFVLKGRNLEGVLVREHNINRRS